MIHCSLQRLSNARHEGVGIGLGDGGHERVHLQVAHRLCDDAVAEGAVGNGIQPFALCAGTHVIGMRGAALLRRGAQALIEALRAAKDVDAVLYQIICGGEAACALAVEALLPGVLAHEGD